MKNVRLLLTVLVFTLAAGAAAITVRGEEAAVSPSPSVFGFSSKNDDGQQRADPAEADKEGPDTVTETVCKESADLAGTSPAGMGKEQDSEALFEAYMETEIFGLREPRRLLRKTALGGPEAVVYRALKEEIGNVAAGVRSGTVFTVSIESLFSGQTLTWTEEELGCEIIRNGKITEAARNAVAERVYYDFDLVLQALLVNCPYELYWYNKTAETLYGAYDLSAGRTIKDGVTQYWVRASGNITFSFPVNAVYAADTYEVDPSGVQRAEAAAAYAKQIVTDCAGLSDYEKLRAYRRTICALTAFNNAATEGLNTDAGDPWQLVWVFDRDTATNVVCEGYSKAFQYLFDLSSFTGSLECYTVTGTICFGTGPLDHMWNVVRMEDGLSYLTDVTNCDTGMMGADEVLFLAGTKQGDVTGGYTICCRTAGIKYTYDSMSLRYFGKENLLLAPSHYGRSDLDEEAFINVTLDRSSLTLVKGGTAVLKASVTPDCVSDRTVTWKSSDPSVADVDKNGRVTVNNKGKAGKTVITARTVVGGKTAKCSVRVLFTDVPLSHPYQRAVYWASDTGITGGMGTTGAFGVSDSLTRGQFVTFLWRMAGRPEPRGKTQTFSDVPVRHSFYKAIQWAAEQRIVGGYTGAKAGLFGPNDPLTRGQAMTMLWRYAGRPAPAAAGQAFSDVPPSHNFYKAVQWASENGITAGYADGTFGVNRTCTRGHGVTFLYRLAV